MIRDFDLIRKILLAVQSSPAGTGPLSVSFPDEYEQATVNAHVELLLEANLLKGRVTRTMSGIRGMAIQGLTWEGHDFIAAANKEALWRHALDTVKDKGGALTFDVLKAVLKELAVKAIGLP